MSSSPYRLQLSRITKAYPGVVANDAIDLAVLPGEIHAILGENGAGKSTLMKIIYGATQPDSGSIAIDGRTVHIASPQQARTLGVAMVFQHFNLFESLTVAQNVWLGLQERHSLAEVTHMIADKAAAYGLPIEPQRLVHTLSVGEMQRVEIIRVLLTNPRLLILDEPTSVLTPQAVQSLFDVLRKLAAEGCSILYISHKLHEIRELCHGCTVLRAGRVTGECNPRNESNASLSRMMIGSEPPALPQRTRQAGAVVLDVRALSLSSPEPFGMDLRDISLQVRAGEIVGIAGVSGNGQRELLQALSGEDRRASADAILLEGRPIGNASPGRRRKLGLHFVPEERLGRGTVPELSLLHNMLLTRIDAVNRYGWINKSLLRTQTQQIIARFGVKTRDMHAPARSLSGGNLQKFIVGREIDAHPKLLILAQPTWGVDVGAAAQIHHEILALRDAGCAIVVISEELEELFALSDRLMVMEQGRISPSIDAGAATVERIGLWMSGLWDEDPAPASTAEDAPNAPSAPAPHTDAHIAMPTPTPTTRTQTAPAMSLQEGGPL